MNIKGFFRWTTILLWQLPILCGADTSAAKQEAIDWIAKNDSEIRQWATQIWEFGEAPFEEHRTAQLLTEKLER
ncbi:MAG: hypothetical protein HY652_11475, partial [Acidobacteria bacterium]|nr:hypothetical protein [Acidobacteriota bacterium]